MNKPQLLISFFIFDRKSTDFPIYRTDRSFWGDTRTASNTSEHFCCVLFFSLNFAFSWPAFCSRLMTLIAPTPSSLFYLRFLLFFLVVFFFTLIISVVSFNLRTFVHIFQLFIATNWDWSVCECVFELSAFDYVATLFVGGIYVWKSFGLSLSVYVCVSASFGAGWAKDRTKNLIAFSNDAKPFFTLVFHCIIGCICVCVFL